MNSPSKPIWRSDVFTGIIEEVGAVATPGARLNVHCRTVLQDTAVGASIAVNGVCLTAVEVDAGGFWCDLSPETLSRTNLGALKPGSEVNLELPLTATSTLDGHLVQGHIDATAAIVSVQRTHSGREVTIELPARLSRFIADKGSIAVDGVSLTVAGVDSNSFKVALIPHTLDMTIAGRYQKGTVVNLEADVIARYVARNLRR